MFPYREPVSKHFDWMSAKAMMKNLDLFLRQMHQINEMLDKGEMPPQAMENLRQLIPHPKKDMISVSFAASKCLDWAVNMLKYYDAWRNTEPKIQRRKEAQRRLEEAEARLAAVRAKVEKVRQDLAELNQKLQSAEDEKQATLRDAEQCQARLTLATRLVDGLQVRAMQSLLLPLPLLKLLSLFLSGSNTTRWCTDIYKLDGQSHCVVGDTLLAAAFVSYIGGFDQYYRLELWKEKWRADLISRGITLTNDIDPLFVLATKSDIAKWNNEGLPADRMSIENAAIIANCKVCSFRISQFLFLLALSLFLLCS